MSFRRPPALPFLSAALIVSCLRVAAESRDARAADESVLSLETIDLELREATDASIDVFPDGQRLVFSLLGDLFLLPIEGGEARALTSGSAFDDWPRISPNGEQVAFLSDRDGEGLYLCDAATGAVRALDTTLESPRHPVWLPDGAAIAVAARGPKDPHGTRAIYRVPVAGGAPTRLGPAAGDFDSPFIWNGVVGFCEAHRQADGSWQTQFRLSNGREPMGSVPGRVAGAFSSRAGNDFVVWTVGQGLDRLLALGSPNAKTQVELDGDVARSHTIAEGVPAMAFSPDGKLCFASGDGQLRRLRDGPSAAPIPFTARLSLDRVTTSGPHPVVPSPRGTFAPRSAEALELLRPVGKITALAAAGDLYLTPFRNIVGPSISWNPGWDMHPHWPWKGSEIVFQRFDGVRRGLISRVVEEEVVRGNIVPLKNPEFALPGSSDPLVLAGWHPDGEHLLVVVQGIEHHPIALYDLGTGALDTLYTPRGSVDPAPYYVGEPPVLCFTDLSPEGVPNHYQWNNGKATPLTALSAGAWDAKVAPDQAHIAFRRDWDLYIAPLRPGHAVQDGEESRYAEGADGPFGWFPNALSVYYTAGSSYLAVRVEDREPLDLPIKLIFGATPKRPNGAIEHVQVVDLASGQVHPDQTIVIEDGRITRIQNAGEVTSLPPSNRVDGTGLFAIPGLVDFNCGLGETWPRTPLAFGVTTMRTVRTSLPLSIAWRDAIDSAQSPGPRLLSSGPSILAFPGSVQGPATHFDEGVLCPRDGTALERAIDLPYQRNLPYAELGSGLPRLLQKSGIAYAAGESVAVGVEVASVRDFVTAVQDGAEFLDGTLPGGTFADLHALVQRAKVSWAPLLQRTAVGEHEWRTGGKRREAAMFGAGVSEYLAERLTPAGTYAHWDDGEVDRLVARLSASLLAAHALGCNLVAGSGAPAPDCFAGASLQSEVASFVAAGLSPLQALRLATANSAAALGAGEKFGTLSIGALGDVVLLRSNPLEDIRALGEVAQVVQEGRPFTPLDLLLPPTRAPSAPKPGADGAATPK